MKILLILYNKNDTYCDYAGWTFRLFLYSSSSSSFFLYLFFQLFLPVPCESKSLFGFTFSIPQFPSLITHHSIFHTRLASSPNFHHSIFFTLFVGPYLSVGTFFFSIPKLIEANIYIYIYI